jgi:hypothetical protein
MPHPLNAPPLSRSCLSTRELKLGEQLDACAAGVMFLKATARNLHLHLHSPSAFVLFSPFRRYG